MDAHIPSQSTLVVLLGAGEWLKWPELNQELSERGRESGSAFARSARDVKAYFLNEKGFKLPKDNLLDLFDAEDEPAPQMQRMAAFLKERGAALANAGHPAAQLILYYAGHGGLAKDDFYLAIRTSEKNSKIASSLSPKSLAEVIAERCQEAALFSAYR